MQKHESSRHSREYLTVKINGLVTNRKNRNIRELYRGINEFTGCDQPIVTVTKDAKGHLLAETHSILNRWKNNFHQIFHMHGTNVGRLKI
jgi:hypothetical protein